MDTGDGVEYLDSLSEFNVNPLWTVMEAAVRTIATTLAFIRPPILTRYISGAPSPYTKSNSSPLEIQPTPSKTDSGSRTHPPRTGRETSFDAHKSLAEYISPTLNHRLSHMGWDR